MCNGWYGCDDVKEFYSQAAAMAPFRVRFSDAALAGGDILARARNGLEKVGSFKSRDQLAKAIRRVMKGRAAVADRQVWVLYPKEVGLCAVKDAAQLVGESGGIVVWASEDSGD